jgi:hypothetical protein
MTSKRLKTRWESFLSREWEYNFTQTHLSDRKPHGQWYMTKICVFSPKSWEMYNINRWTCKGKQAPPIKEMSCILRAQTIEYLLSALLYRGWLKFDRVPLGGLPHLWLEAGEWPVSCHDSKPFTAASWTGIASPQPAQTDKRHSGEWYALRPSNTCLTN